MAYNRRLQIAIANGETNVIRDYLNGPDFRPEESDWVIEQVALTGRPDTMKFLLSHPSIQPTSYSRAIKYAVDRDNIEIVRLLLDDGRIDPTVPHNMVIRTAIQKGFTEIVSLLLSDPRVDSSVDYDYLLSLAVESKQTAAVQVLSVRPRVTPRNLNKAFQTAVSNGYLAIVELLLADPRVDPSDDDNLAILYASTFGQEDIVRLLMQDPRVNPSAMDNESIRMAADEKYPNIIGLLLQDPRVDPSAINNEAIRSTVNNGDVPSFQLLISDPRVNSTVDYLQLETLAMEKDQVGIVQALVLDPHVKFSDLYRLAFNHIETQSSKLILSMEVVRVAAEKDDPAIIEVLLHQGVADPTYNNYEAFFQAVLNRNLPVVKEIVKYIDPRVNDHYAIILAAQNGDEEMVQFLVSVGLDPHIDGDLPALVAEQNGHLKLAAYLSSYKI